VPAGSLDWSCLATADHAVDCVYAPAFFLASRRTDRYPEAGDDMTLGDAATPALLVDSLRLATRLLVAVVRDTPGDVEAILFARPATLGRPRDMPPRAALELAIHSFDVCSGLGVPFAPPPAICTRLRDHTAAWPLWGAGFAEVTPSGDAWADLLRAAGRVTPAS
jgi:hypothetical protein